jgi:hypothetical protein
MKSAALIVAMLLAATAVAATSTTSTKHSTKGGKPYFEATEKMTAQATVLSINQKNRHASLKTESGDTVKVVAGPEAVNFNQVKKGDVVNITYTEKLTIHVEPAGAAGSSAEVTTANAKAGEKPSASASAKVQYKATITAIDKDKGTVMLQGSSGDQFEVTPKRPENLDKVKVGDVVVFTYSEAIAGSIEKTAPSNK